VYDLSRELVRRGHTVEVVTTDALDGERRMEAPEAVVDGIRVRYLANVSNALAFRQKIFLPRGATRALAEGAARADVAHLTDFRTWLNLAAHPVLARARVPYVLAPCGSLPRAGTVKKLLKVVYDVVCGFALVRDAACLVAVSAHEVEGFRRLGGRADRIAVVPHGIDPAEFAALPPAGGFRREHGIGADELLLVFLGRIHSHKGLDVLLSAFACLVRDRPDARLAIVGRDDGWLDRSRAVSRQLSLGSRVVFTGPIYGDARIAAYADADLFVLTPTHFEETSIAVLEAMAAGTPALVTHQAPVPGMVEAGAGDQVECTVDAVHAALARLAAAGRARLARMGVAARALVLERFAWPAIAGRFEELYAGAVAARTARL
jgi:glycosyltransferase involved in cell wall biosynthesis